VSACLNAGKVIGAQGSLSRFECPLLAGRRLQAAQVRRCSPAIVTCAGTISAWRAEVPLRLCETELKVAQAGLLIAFDACGLDLRRLPGLQLGHQLDPPHQLRHQRTLEP
jgi:hypothetical protein